MRRVNVVKAEELKVDWSEFYAKMKLIQLAFLALLTLVSYVLKMWLGFFILLGMDLMLLADIIYLKLRKVMEHGR